MKSHCFIITAPHHGVLTQESVPEPRDGELLCRPLRIGLCGTDRLVYAGEMPAAIFPRVPGHEVVAEVLEDRSSRGLAAGTRIVVDPYKNCGSCHACRVGRPNCCRLNQTLGVQRDGIMREHFTLDADRAHCLPQDEDVRRFVLAEPLTLALHVLERAGQVAGRWVLIAGVGNVGSLVLRVMQQAGARVIAWSLSEGTLSKALALGAEHAICATDPDAREKVMQITSGEGVSVAVECAGKSQAVEDCIALAAFAGRVILHGHSKLASAVRGSDLVFKELDVLGSRNSHGCFPRALRCLSDRPEVWNELISHQLPWSAVQEAFDLTKGPSGTYSKIVLDFPD